MHATRWIAVHAERQQECRLGGITGVFVDGKKEVLRGTTTWFLRCKHFSFDKSKVRSPLFLPAGGREDFLK
jgi:hypothetical protein